MGINRQLALYYRLYNAAYYTPVQCDLCCVPLGSEIRISQLVFPSRKSGCSRNSEFPTWKYDISDLNGTIFPTEKLVNTSFRAQWNAALVQPKGHGHTHRIKMFCSVEKQKRESIYRSCRCKKAGDKC